MRLNPPLGFGAMSNFPALDGSAPKKQKFDAAPEMGIDPSKRYTATMETSMGTLVIALDPIAAPITVNNFVFLAAQHYYDGVIFHRIIHNFMCQGGDPGGDGRGGPGYRFVDELPKTHRYVNGAVAMANSGAKNPNSNGSQFFLVYKDTFLPGDYTIWGKITSGLELLIEIGNVGAYKIDPTSNKAFYSPDGYPVQPVEIKTVTVR